MLLWVYAFLPCLLNLLFLHCRNVCVSINAKQMLPNNFYLFLHVWACRNLCSNCMVFYCSWNIQGWLHFVKAYFIKSFGTKTLYKSMVLVGCDILTKRKFRAARTPTVSQSLSPDKAWLSGKKQVKSIIQHSHAAPGDAYVLCFSPLSPLVMK